MRGVRLDPEGNEFTTLDRLVSLTGKRVLEVGAGDGRLTWGLAERARSLVALDPDRQALARARRAVPKRLKSRIHFETAGAEALPFADGEFDVVLFTWSL